MKTVIVICLEVSATECYFVLVLLCQQNSGGADTSCKYYVPCAGVVTNTYSA